MTEAYASLPLRNVIKACEVGIRHARQQFSEHKQRVPDLKDDVYEGYARGLTWLLNLSMAAAASGQTHISITPFAFERFSEWYEP